MRVNNYVIDLVSYLEAFLRNRNNDTVTTTKPNGLFWTLKTAPNSRKNTAITNSRPSLLSPYLQNILSAPFLSQKELMALCNIWKSVYSLLRVKGPSLLPEGRGNSLHSFLMNHTHTHTHTHTAWFLSGPLVGYPVTGWDLQSRTLPFIHCTTGAHRKTL